MGGHNVITNSWLGTWKCALFTAWEDGLPSTQFSFYAYFVLYLLLTTTVYHSALCMHFSIEAELRALICGLGSNLAAERGVSSQCREIHTNQPADHKATRVEVNHEVIPCTISLPCQKRSWHAVAHITVIKRKFLSTFICAYYAFCFVAFPELKISVCVLALDYGLINFYFSWFFL